MDLMKAENLYTVANSCEKWNIMLFLVTKDIDFIS